MSAKYMKETDEEVGETVIICTHYSSEVPFHCLTERRKHIRKLKLNIMPGKLPARTTR